MLSCTKTCWVGFCVATHPYSPHSRCRLYIRTLQNRLITFGRTQLTCFWCGIAVASGSLLTIALLGSSGNRVPLIHLGCAWRSGHRRLVSVVLAFWGAMRARTTGVTLVSRANVPTCVSTSLFVSGRCLRVAPHAVLYMYHFRTVGRK